MNKSYLEKFEHYFSRIWVIVHPGVSPVPPRSMGELAGDIRCDASYVALVSKHLEAEGLVERRLDPLTDIKGFLASQRFEHRSKLDQWVLKLVLLIENHAKFGSSTIKCLTD